MAETEFVHVAREPGLIRLTFDRPPLNIWTNEMIGKVNTAFEGLGDDPHVKAVVLAAAGAHFSAGVDIGDHLDERWIPMLDGVHRLMDLMARIEVPLVAVVRGHCLGGAWEVVSFCDLVIASETAQFGQPEIKVGVFPPVAAVHLATLIGHVRAAERLFTGEPISAEEALRLGLVNRVVPDGDLVKEADAFLGRLLTKSAAVLRHTKRAMVPARNALFYENLRKAEVVYRTLMATADAQEGLRAFLEKRPPRWQDA